MSAYAYHAPDGTPVVLQRGARVAWTSPAGLGGTSLTGVVVGVDVSDGRASHGCLCVVSVDADPSASLRALRNELRASAPRPSQAWTPWGMWPVERRPAPIKNGIDGEGGLVLFTGDGVLRAIDAGSLVVRPPTARSWLRACRVLLPRWLRATRHRLVDRVHGWVERGLVDGIGRLGPDEEGARRRVVRWLVVVQARRQRARERWWRST